jgi:hypothetical protein
MIEYLKIVGLCILAAVVYGIAHDQVTARVCLEYFTVFHPRIFPTESPTLLAIGWGVIATWWMGGFLGIGLAAAARVGSRPKLSARDVLRPILQLLLVMACCALFFGLVGFMLTRAGLIRLPPWLTQSEVGSSSRFMADWWAHNASYASGFFGGLALWFLTFRCRGQLHRTVLS